MVQDLEYTHDMYIQWDQCIMDTLGPITSYMSDYQGVLNFQVTLYDKSPFDTITTLITIRYFILIGSTKNHNSFQCNMDISAKWPQA